MARYACLKVRRDHVVINNKKSRGETSMEKKQNSFCKNWKKHAYELPETRRSPGNAKPDRSPEGFL